MEISKIYSTAKGSGLLAGYCNGVIKNCTVSGLKLTYVEPDGQNIDACIGGGLRHQPHSENKGGGDKSGSYCGKNKIYCRTSGIDSGTA